MFDETWTGGGSIFQETNKKDLTEISLCSTTIDNILLDAGGNGDSLLFKMDIEGSEGAAMEGFRRMHDFQKVVGLIEFSEQRLNLSNHNAKFLLNNSLDSFAVYRRTRDGKKYHRVADEEDFLGGHELNEPKEHPH